MCGMILPVPSTVAKALPCVMPRCTSVVPATAQPPRIPFVVATDVVVRTVPLVAFVGITTVPPTVCVSAPRFSVAVPPVPLVTLMTEP